jgi:hypothetical protein
VCNELHGQRQRLLGLLADKPSGGMRDPEVRNNIEIIAAHVAGATDLYRRHAQRRRTDATAQEIKDEFAVVHGKEQGKVAMRRRRRVDVTFAHQRSMCGTRR